eukprot:scaffold1766_cov401-Prasinococcus_capsulatus_cf.AAC.37
MLNVTEDTVLGKIMQWRCPRVYRYAPIGVAFPATRGSLAMLSIDGLKTRCWHYEARQRQVSISLTASSRHELNGLAYGATKAFKAIWRHMVTRLLSSVLPSSTHSMQPCTYSASQPATIGQLLRLTERLANQHVHPWLRHSECSIVSLHQRSTSLLAASLGQDEGESRASILALRHAAPLRHPFRCDP